MKFKPVIAILILAGVVSVRAENMIRNGSFEQRDKQNSDLPDFWTAATSAGDLPLEFTGEHYQGATCAMLVGDGKHHAWRQIIASPTARSFTLSAMVKAEGASMAADGYSYLYGHILYKGRSYEEATQFYAKLPPGTYEWKRVSIAAVCNHPDPIDQVLITITGNLSSGRMLIDQVELSEDAASTPEALLANKVNDLLKQIDRVGDVDPTVGQAREHLKSAAAAIAIATPDLQAATDHWVQAAQALSHGAWAAMYPDAMSDKSAEARMIYHGHANTREGVDRYIKVLETANANGVLLSLGSWESASYQSDLLPMEAGYDTFDGLKYFIEQAHQRNIKVFGYVAAFYGTNAPSQDVKSIYHTHPEWFATGPDANMPLFPDPANPQAVDFLVKVYTELAQKYDLDGIGMDYIRYPVPNALNYDENNRQQILSRYGIDIKDAGDLWKDPVKWAKIREYRGETVGKVVRRVHDAIKAARPGISIIACLISNPDEASEYAQNWPVSSNLLDYASPMNYDDVSADASLVARQRDIFQQNHAVFIPAIGGMPEVHQSWTITKWAQRVAIQRKTGCDGMIIYRIGDLDPAVVAFFGRGPYYGKATFPPPLKK